MKELKNIQPEETKIVNERKIKIEKKITSIRPKNGHKLWELDMNTGKITEVDIRKINFNMSAGALVKKAILQPHCLYWPALNIKNAQKGFKRMIKKMLDE